MRGDERAAAGFGGRLGAGWWWIGRAVSGLMFAAVAALAARGSTADELLPSYEAPTVAIGAFELQPTLTVIGAAFVESNPWYGEPEANVGGDADRWFEGSVEAGFNGVLGLGGYGAAYGTLTGLGQATRGGLDLAGSNLDERDTEDLAVGQAFAGWRSGDLFGALGEDAVDLSIGRQNYFVGTGFLIGDGAADGGERGAYWIGRDAFDLAGIARLQAGELLAEGFYLAPDDDPDTGTEVAGVNLEYAIGEAATVGATYLNVVDSDLAARDGMNVFDVRASATPVPALLPGLLLAGEFAYEDNGGELEAYGYYGEVGYEFGGAPWTPYLSYRYAFFSGDDPDSGESEDFDPLFYGFEDWGTWFQGEILGEFALANSNLISHTVRLRAQPTEAVTTNLLYHYFRLDEPEALGVTSDEFAHEVNLIVDWTLSGNLLLTGVAGVTVPEDGAEEYTGGDDTWAHFMLAATLSF